jgi:hypothetical protein
MKLSKSQLEYIKNRRLEMGRREKDIRSFGDDLYKSTDLCRELGQMRFEHSFYNHMIKFHNVDINAEKESTVDEDK